MNYLFVDGAYLSRAMGDWGMKWYGEAVSFSPIHLGSQFDKVFYYDALPPQKEDMSDADHARVISERMGYFNVLRSFAGWHVSFGDAKRRGRGSGKRVDQKEVDVLMAVDMLTHAHRKNADRMSFVAGDLDFRPLLEALVREGTYVTLVFDPRSIAEELAQAADALRPLHFMAMHYLTHDDFRRRHPAPIIDRTTAQRGLGNANEILRGFVNDSFEAIVWRSAIHDVRVAITAAKAAEEGWYGYVECDDLDFAKRLFEEEFVSGVEWRVLAAS